MFGGRIQPAQLPVSRLSNAPATGRNVLLTKDNDCTFPAGTPCGEAKNQRNPDTWPTDPRPARGTTFANKDQQGRKEDLRSQEVDPMRRIPIIAMAALALLLTGGGAAAEEETTPSPEESRRRSAEILAHIDQRDAETSWFNRHLDRIQVHRKAGLAYTQPVALAERDLELSVRGPALGKKRFGLTFEIRF
jgi:hypothetical protein